MYYGLTDYQIGDVNVLKHDGLYHLFHLTLPNHAYIAHAVSRDGLKWRRVKNALFIGDPPAWDDDMLWTMHVSSDPYREGAWRMFYTGLCMKERSRVQRVGLARSDDLYTWRKADRPPYPLEISGRYYEHALSEGRHWVSFRDPFCYQEDGAVYLLAAARARSGPVVRRGCVALVREQSEHRYEFLPPLFQPMQYDDVEVPGLARIGGRYYLIGSIREDVKVHYWWSDRFHGPYSNYSDNVLLPQGNYAARLSGEDGHYLVWNFFFKGLTVNGPHFMAPPKELAADDGGQLYLRSFRGFEGLKAERRSMGDLTPLRALFGNRHGASSVEGERFRISSHSGWEAFLLAGHHQNVILEGVLTLEKRGKCGLVLRIDESGDGYYLSLELFKGIAQIRAWGRRAGGEMRNAFRYDQLQAAHYIAQTGPHPFRLIAYEQYIEFSLNGRVLLTLADDTYESGGVGFYVEGAEMVVESLTLSVLTQPETESYPAGLPNY